MREYPVVPEVTAQELLRRLEGGDPPQVLDVRPPFLLGTGVIEQVPAERFHNVACDELVGSGAPEEATGLGVQEDVVVVCARGNASRIAAKFLNDRGYQSVSLQGGMAAWTQAGIARELEPPAGLDRLVQYDRVGKEALSYILFKDGEAMLIDPPRDPAPLLDVVREAGAALVRVCDTHAHADYISGGPVLAGTHGIPYSLHAGDVIYPYDGRTGRISVDALEDGMRLSLGGTSVSVRHTPGHTAGSCTFLVGQEAAFTGDFVFIGSVGRPDLGGKTAEWTGELWRSLEAAKAAWPGTITIYPAHYAGEGERRADRSVGADFGDIREGNEPLGLGTEAEFRAWVEARAGAFPDTYPKIKAINLGLLTVDEEEALELEAGKNQCALG